MDHLSISSIDFIKNTDRIEADSEWQLMHAALFCEIYDVIRYTKDHLDKISTHPWSLSFDNGAIDDAVLRFKFSLRSQEHSFSKMDIIISPDETSYIASDHLKHIYHYSAHIQEIKNIISTAAYRRYFAQHSHLPQSIKTVIPRAQICSRYLGDYLIHLIEMLQPILALGARHAHAA
jgi:hypothetical protein